MLEKSACATSDRRLFATNDADALQSLPTRQVGGENAARVSATQRLLRKKQSLPNPIGWTEGAGSPLHEIRMEGVTFAA